MILDHWYPHCGWHGDPLSLWVDAGHSKVGCEQAGAAGGGLPSGHRLLIRSGCGCRQGPVLWRWVSRSGHKGQSSFWGSYCAPTGHSPTHSVNSVHLTKARQVIDRSQFLLKDGASALVLPQRPKSPSLFIPL